ncbi:MAG: pantoate--beta-alanine ligase [Rickettsiales bacterium]|nr:pantoate--beta-alanine ligase [Rickettsiales bacterium]
MKICRNINEIKAFIAENKNQKIALVPTMGALHQGHLTLVQEAKKYGEIVIATIFINPLQFNNQADLTNYPNNQEADFAMLAEQKVDAVFAPLSNEIYPEKLNFILEPTTIANCLCGKYRPNHFAGVAIIIMKLFNLIKPDFAIFGEKDYQQLIIVKKLVDDFNFSTQIIATKTVRENSGLAMSSRNQRLSAQAITIAPNIFKALNSIKEDFKNFLSQSSFNSQNFLKTIEKLLIMQKEGLINKGFQQVEYLEIRNQNLEELQEIVAKNFSPNTIASEKLRIFIALHLESVRLIDNIEI